MRADLALILFVLTLAGGIALLVLRGSAGAVSGGSGAAGAGRALKNEKIS